MSIAVLADVLLRLKFQGFQWSHINALHQERLLALKNEQLWKGLINFDKRLGWVSRPNTHANYPEWIGSISIDSEGMRSNGDACKSCAEPPLIAVGDSFTFGQGLSDKNTWPAILQKLTMRRVLNAGVGGYGLDQMFMRAQDLERTMANSTLIIGMIPNDIWRVGKTKIWGASKPTFRIENGNLVGINPSPSHAIRIDFIYHLLDYSFLYHRLCNSERISERIRGYLRPPIINWTMDSDNYAEISCAIMKQFAKLKFLHGIFLMEMYAQGELENIPEYYKQFQDCVKTIKGIKIVDLYNQFDSAMKEGDAIYIPHDGHLNSRGTQRVAQDFYEVLKAQPQWGRPGRTVPTPSNITGSPSTG